MGALDLPSRCAFCMLLLFSAVGISAAEEDARGNGDAVARQYQTRGQEALDAVLPRLISALTVEERAQLGKLTVDVVPSRDPLRVQLERASPEAKRLVVSVGFLILQDLLVDASVVAVVSGTEPALVDYSVDVAKFALQANYPAKYRNPEVDRPKPFWHSIGWTSERYATFRDDPQTKKLISRATIQTYAWLVAYAISDGLNTSTNKEAILQVTSDLLVRARFAPVPALGASVLFFATKNPNEQHRNAWICDARGILAAAILIGERDRKTATAARAASIEPRLREWQRVADLLQHRGACVP